MEFRVIVWAIEVRKLYLSCIETCALVPAGLEDGGITVIIMSQLLFHRFLVLHILILDGRRLQTRQNHYLRL